MSSPSDPPPTATPSRRRLVEAFVLLVWVVLVVHAAYYVTVYGSPVASRDDMEILPAFEPSATPRSILDHFWQPLNEHRIVLSQFLHYAAAGGLRDFRGGGWMQVALLAITALVCIAAVRRLRGRTCLEDALFPLLLLHWSNGENLLLGTQVCVALALLLATVATCALVWAPGPPTRGRVGVVAACVVLLPWCGGFGLAQAPAFAAWMLVAGVAAWRARRSMDAAVALGGCLAFAGCVALYFTDFAWPPSPPVDRRLDIGLGIVVQVLSMTFGGLAPYEPWVSVPAALALLAVALGCAFAGLRRSPDQRWRALGLATAVVAVLLLAASIAWSRQSSWPYSGWAARYSLAPGVLAVAAVFGALLFGGRIVARAVPVGLALLLAAAMPLHVERGTWMAAQLELMMRPFLTAVEADQTVDELARTYTGLLYPDEVGLRYRLGVMRAARLPPFDHVPTPTPVDEARLDVRPTVLATASPPMERRVGGLTLTSVLAPGRLSVELPDGARTVFGRFAALPIDFAPETPAELRTLGFRVRAVHERDGHAPRELLRRTLQPNAVGSDRGLQEFTFDLEPGGGRVVFEVESLDPGAGRKDWLGLSALGVR
ncbi:MAG: hypothetical protein IPJ77_06720 [Planctomycetes bacterium]|nr:hypothetical protein [Planctomycetota bacterium]